jgi:large subunit ribosomal protein L15
MSLLSKLKPRNGSREAPKRLGRGESSGLGKTSGKGHKGQRARSSPDIGVGFEGGQMPLHRRSPKWGFTQRNRKIYLIVNLMDLEAKFKSGDDVTPEALKSKGLISHTRIPVKVLGTGELKNSLKVSVHAYSQKAKASIENAKGTATVIAWKKKTA